MPMQRFKVEVDKLTPYVSQKITTKSTFKQRLEVFHRMLENEDAENAAEDESIVYEELRAAVADEFVVAFEMLPDGAKKVAGVTIGSSDHGLHLRKQNGKHSVVLLKNAWRTVVKALEVANALPANASDRQVLVAVRAALGLPAPKPRGRKPKD